MLHEIPEEAYTDKCQVCGEEEILFFDRKSYYILCSRCRQRMSEDDDTISRFALIIMPNIHDVESAYRQITNPGTELLIETIFDKIKANAKYAGYVLKKGWQEKLTNILSLYKIQ